MKDISSIPTPLPEFNDRDTEGRKLAVVYQCRVKWSDLQPTDHDQVRYCTNCSQPVFHVLDTKDFARAVAAKQCVMVKPKDRTRNYLGGVGYLPYKEEDLLNWDDDEDSSKQS